MSASVLITYATRYGSTQEVAEAVAATLCEYGLAVDIQPMREVRTLAGYNAVVLGAADDSHRRSVRAQWRGSTAERTP